MNKIKDLSQSEINNVTGGGIIGVSQEIHYGEVMLVVGTFGAMLGTGIVLLKTARYYLAEAAIAAGNLAVDKGVEGAKWLATQGYKGGCYVANQISDKVSNYI